MEKQEIIKTLKDMEAFLESCDEGLADEIGGLNKISGRIFKASQELSALRRELEAAK